MLPFTCRLLSTGKIQPDQHQFPCSEDWPNFLILATQRNAGIKKTQNYETEQQVTYSTFPLIEISLLQWHLTQFSS